jgi:hypothetical protein
MGYKLQLTNLQNVAANSTATLKCPVGKGAPTYDQIVFQLAGGALPAHVTAIRGKANGRIFMDESSFTDVGKRDTYRGIANTAAFPTIDFTEPRARNGSAEQLVASVPGALLQDLSFELKLAAGYVGTIVAVANYRPPTTNPYIRKLLNTAVSFSAAGTDGAPNIVYLPLGQAGGKIKRIWIHEDGAGAVTHAVVRIANNVVHEADRTAFEDDQKRNLLVPQASICVLDFVSDGNLAGMLDTGATPQVELRLTTSAAGAYRIYYELIDPIGRL